MKKCYYYVLLCFLVGCSQFENTDKQAEGDCLVSFSLSGEITNSESLLTKSSAEDIYLVQVFQGNAPFAFGVFDNPSLIQLYLKKGASHKFVVSVIKNGKSVTDYNSDYGLNCGSRNYHSPNSYHLSNLGPFATENGYLAINTFYYNSFSTVPIIISGTSHTTLSDYDRSNAHFDCIMTAVIKGQRYPACEDWFYGERSFVPTGQFETLIIDLKRVGFKLKYELSGVTDGAVTVLVYNEYQDNSGYVMRYLIKNTNSGSTYSSDPLFYAFYDARNAWLYADDYMENFTLSVSWARGIGITEDYGTKTIQLKRNCLNNIKINLGSNDQSAGMNLTVEAESTIGAEAVTIPVQ